MTIDAPDFDPTVDHHNAIAIAGDDGDICHAVVSDYSESEERFKTECGDPVHNWSESKPRVEYEDDGVAMCPDCWPDAVLEEV